MQKNASTECPVFASSVFRQRRIADFPSGVECSRRRFLQKGQTLKYDDIRFTEAARTEVEGEQEKVTCVKYVVK